MVFLRVLSFWPHLLIGALITLSVALLASDRLYNSAVQLQIPLAMPVKKY